MILSDPMEVGRTESQVKSTISASTYYAYAPKGGFGGTVYTGSDSVSNFTYAHNGRITISARPVPAAQ